MNRRVAISRQRSAVSRAITRPLRNPQSEIRIPKWAAVLVFAALPLPAATLADPPPVIDDFCAWPYGSNYPPCDPQAPNCRPMDWGRVGAHGSDFQLGMDARLVKTGETDIVNQFASGGGTWFRMVFDVTDAAPGWWDLVVTNPDAQSDTLVDALELLPCPPPTVTGTSPNGIVESAAASVRIAIMGDDLIYSTLPSTLTLRQTGWPDMSGDASLGADAEPGDPAYATIDLTGAPLGAYDVIYTRADGQSVTLPGGFQIVPDPDVRARTLSTWGGAVKTVFIDEAVDPYLAYVGSGRNLVILDLTDPANIVELGRIDLENLVLDLKVRDGYAYVSTFGAPNHFCTVDVADPANMRVAWSSDNHTGSPWEVELYDYLAWVRYGADLRIFNVTDPEDVIWGGPAIWSIAETFTIDGDLMYVATDDHPHQLRIYDLSVDPVSPELIGSVELADPPAGDDPTDIAVEGNYAYLTIRKGVLAVVDVSDPQAPVDVGYEDFGCGFCLPQLAVAGGVAYVGALELKVFDVATDPANPTLVSTFPTHGSVWRGEAVGDRAYVMDRGEGLLILDVSDPANPVRLGNWHSPWMLRKMAKDGHLLYVSDHFNGITILDVSDPLGPALVGVYQTSEASGQWGDNWGLEVRDGLAYLSAGHGGLEIIDASDSAYAFLAGSFPGFWSTALELDGDIAHVGVAGGAGFMVNFDVSDPQNIVDIGFVGLGMSPITIDTTPDGIAHMPAGPAFGGGGTTYAIDTSDPENPFLLSEVHLGPLDGPRDVVVQGDLRYVTNDQSDGTGGLYIQDVSDPSEPVTIGFFEAGASTGVALRNGLLYLVGKHYWPRGLLVFDVSDPASPVQLAHATVPGARHVLVDGRYAYVTGGTGENGPIGLTILDVGIPGDADADLDLDLGDFAAVQRCYTGAGGTLAGAECLFADFDQDDDVDLDDVAAFAGLMVGPDPPPLGATGACCLPDGTCTGGLNEGYCIWNQGGVYQGDGTTCDTTVCPPTGVCCLAYGSEVCVEYTEDACLNHGGTYEGDGTDCLTSSCPLGACCDSEDGTCTEKTPAACTATGGTYQGDGTSCGSVTCPYGRYSNEIDPMTSVALAGAGLQIADDMTLEGTGARDLTYLDLRVYGNGGGAFDVTVELWTDCPGDGGRCSLRHPKSDIRHQSRLHWRPRPPLLPGPRPMPTPSATTTRPTATRDTFIGACHFRIGCGWT